MKFFPAPPARAADPPGRRSGIFPASIGKKPAQKRERRFHPFAGLLSYSLQNEEEYTACERERNRPFRLVKSGDADEKSIFSRFFAQKRLEVRRQSNNPGEKKIKFPMPFSGRTAENGRGKTSSGIFFLQENGLIQDERHFRSFRISAPHRAGMHASVPGRGVFPKLRLWVPAKISVSMREKRIPDKPASGPKIDIFRAGFRKKRIQISPFNGEKR